MGKSKESKLKKESKERKKSTAEPGLSTEESGKFSIAMKEDPLKLKRTISKGKKLVSQDTIFGAKSTTSLHDAVIGGKANAIHCLLKDGVNINSVDQKGESGLHLAVRMGNKGIVQILLENDASVDLVSHEGKTPLHVAAIQGDNDIVRLLLWKNARRDAIDRNLRTALSLACANGHTDVAKTLISTGAAVSVSDISGATPLHLACEQGSKSIARALIAANAEINKLDCTGNTPMHSAIQNKRFKLESVLIEAGADVTIKNKKGFNVLELKSYILNEKNETPTKDINELSGQVLEACRQGKEEETLSLIRVAPKEVFSWKDSRGRTLLHSAAFAGNATVVRSLLEAKSEVNKIDDCGESSLHKAVREGKDLVVKELLEYDADVNCADNDGWTSLHSACLWNRHSIVEILLCHNADVNKKNSQGKTPLQLAIERDHQNCIRVLNRRMSNPVPNNQFKRDSTNGEAANVEANNNSQNGIYSESTPKRSSLSASSLTSETESTSRRDSETTPRREAEITPRRITGESSISPRTPREVDSITMMLDEAKDLAIEVFYKNDAAPIIEYRKSHSQKYRYVVFIKESAPFKEEQDSCTYNKFKVSSCWNPKARLELLRASGANLEIMWETKVPSLITHQLEAELSNGLIAQGCSYVGEGEPLKEWFKVKLEEVNNIIKSSEGVISNRLDIYWESVFEKSSPRYKAILSKTQSTIHFGLRNQKQPDVSVSPVNRNKSTIYNLKS